MTPALRICVVCLGNICRSPIADVVLNAEAARAGLADRLHVESAGTAAYHLGKPMDPRAAAALAHAGFDATGHRARQFQPEWFERFDLVLAMDADNRRNLRALAQETGATTTIQMFRSFDPVRDISDGDATGDGPDVEDPYYAGADAFADTVRVVRRTSVEIVRRLRENETL